MLKLFILPVVMCAALSACGNFQSEGIEDVRLVSIEFTPAQTLEYYRLQNVASHSQLFAVNFTTATDLHALTNMRERYYVRAEMLIGEIECSDSYENFGSSAGDRVISQTFVRQNRVFHGVQDPYVTSNVLVDEPFQNDSDTYHFYFGISFSDEGRFRAGVTQTGPICFYIDAYTFLNERMTSSLVSIPRETIVEANSRARIR